VHDFVLGGFRQGIHVVKRIEQNTKICFVPINTAMSIMLLQQYIPCFSFMINFEDEIRINKNHTTHWPVPSVDARRSIHRHPSCKHVRFHVDGNDNVEEEIFYYDYPEGTLNTDLYSSPELIRENIINAKRSCRDFLVAHLADVRHMEFIFEECEWNAPDLSTISGENFFQHWCNSDARGLERQLSRRTLFANERVRVIRSVLTKQKLLRSLRGVQMAESLRQCSLSLSHRSRVFAFHLAKGDERLANVLKPCLETGLIAPSA
jgi:hypothetical protein